MLEDDDIDPDLFEAVVLGMTAISTVASFAASYLQIRAQSSRPVMAGNDHHVRDSIRQAERAFDDICYSLNEIVIIFRRAESRHVEHLNKTSIGFGSIAYNFSSDEYNAYSNHLQKLLHSHSNLQANLFSLIGFLRFSKMTGEEVISDNLEDIKKSINRILFDRLDFDSVLREMRDLQHRGHAFLKSMRFQEN